MAVKQLFTNNAVSLLTTAISASSTTLSVMSGHGAMFPLPQAGEFFTVTLEDQAALNREIVHVTQRNGDVFTISRGQEGTQAQAWSASSGSDTLVDHRVTAESLQRLANHYFNPSFTALTDYKEALDYLLSLGQTDLGPVYLQLQQLQQQLDGDNDYANPSFPALTNFRQALDYLLQGSGPTPPGSQAVDVAVTTQVSGSETIITVPSAYVPGTTAVYIGGLRQKRGVDFLEGSPTQLRLQFIHTPAQVVDGQHIVVDYVVA